LPPTAFGGEPGLAVSDQSRGRLKLTDNPGWRTTQAARGGSPPIAFKLYRPPDLHSPVTRRSCPVPAAGRRGALWGVAGRQLARCVLAEPFQVLAGERESGSGERLRSCKQRGNQRHLLGPARQPNRKRLVVRPRITLYTMRRLSGRRWPSSMVSTAWSPRLQPLGLADRCWGRHAR
jgi:hypothetical protein